MSTSFHQPDVSTCNVKVRAFDYIKLENGEHANFVMANLKPTSKMTKTHLTDTTTDKNTNYRAKYKCLFRSRFVINLCSFEVQPKLFRRPNFDKKYIPNKVRHNTFPSLIPLISVRLTDPILGI